MLVLALLVALQGAEVDSVAAPRVTVAVRPETVTVGQHFEVVVSVSAPVGARIAFPVGPDSSRSVDAVDPRALSAPHDGAAVSQTALYRLAAWDTGQQRAHFGEVVISVGATARHVPLTDVGVYVRSVLPPDTALRVPRPARGLILVSHRRWIVPLAAALALLVIAALLARFLRRRRPAPVPDDAVTMAMREFARLDTLHLVEAGERGRYVTLAAGALRDYLGRRIPEADRALSTEELLQRLSARRELPLARLARLLQETDLIKFAHRPVGRERARELGREARLLVNDVERALTPRTPERAA